MSARGKHVGGTLEEFLRETGELAEVRARAALKPLHGTKTHPLSAHALGVLRELRAAPRPRNEVNPGVVNRLLREGLVTEEERPSPYKTRKGTVVFLVISAAGIAALDGREA